MARLIVYPVSCLMCLFLAAGPLLADENASVKKPKDTRSAEQATISKLVSQLGDSSFLKRRQATDQLIRLGLKARPVLQQALRNPDLEIRMQAHRILVHTVQVDFESRLAAFVAGSSAEGVPGWTGFRDLVGESRTARRLFAEMIRAESPMLSSIEKQKDLSAKFNKRVQNLRNTMYGNYGRTQFTTPTIATLLYVACNSKTKNSSMTASNLNSLLTYSNTKTAFTTGGNNVLMKRLLKKWILRKGQSYNDKYYGVSLSLNYNLRDTGIKLAREIMATPNVPSYIVQYAAIAIGKYGDPKDIGLLTPHLRDQTVCHTWSNPQIKKEPIRIQVRDVVIAMVIRLHDEDPKEYGYKLLINTPDTMYQVYSFGFLSDEDRTKTIRKWNEFAKKKKLGHSIPVVATVVKNPGPKAVRRSKTIVLQGAKAAPKKPAKKRQASDSKGKKKAGTKPAAKSLVKKKRKN